MAPPFPHIRVSHWRPLEWRGSQRAVGVEDPVGSGAEFVLCAVRCVITLSGPCSHYLRNGPSFSLKCSLELMRPSRPAFECGGHPLGLPMEGPKLGRGHEVPLAELRQKGPGPPARALCPE